MTNVQLYLAIGVPISGIREDMRGFRAEIRADLQVQRSEFRQGMQSGRRCTICGRI